MNNKDITVTSPQGAQKYCRNWSCGKLPEIWTSLHFTGCNSSSENIDWVIFFISPFSLSDFRSLCFSRPQWIGRTHFVWIGSNHIWITTVRWSWLVEPIPWQQCWYWNNLDSIWLLLVKTNHEIWRVLSLGVY